MYFFSCVNLASLRVMSRIGFRENPEGDWLCRSCIQRVNRGMEAGRSIDDIELMVFCEKCFNGECVVLFSVHCGRSSGGMF